MYTLVSRSYHEPCPRTLGSRGAGADGWVACWVGLHLFVELAIQWLTLSAASGLDFPEHSTLLCKEHIVPLSRRKEKSHSEFRCFMRNG